MSKLSRLFRGSVPFDIRFKTAMEKFVYCAGSVTNGNTTTTWRISYRSVCELNTIIRSSIMFNSVALYGSIVWSG